MIASSKGNFGHLEGSAAAIAMTRCGVIVDGLGRDATTDVRRRSGARAAGLWVGAGALLYLFGGLFLTMLVNVPMNEALGALHITLDTEVAEASRIWTDYSDPWKVWNITRTVFSGLAMVCVGIAISQRNA